MNILRFLQTKYSIIFFDKRLDRVFALKNTAELLKHLSAELLKP